MQERTRASPAEIAQIPEPQLFACNKKPDPSHRPVGFRFSNQGLCAAAAGLYAAAVVVAGRNAPSAGVSRGSAEAIPNRIRL